jgi:hypothetical protein
MDKIYDYVIVGTGPTGLALSWYLAKENKTVLLIDKETTIGGCHRVQRVNGLLTEHGPRVYSDVYLNFIRMLKDMNLNFNELFTPYNFDISNVGNKKLKFGEKVSFAIAFIKLVFNPIYGQDISMKQFMIENSFSAESTDYLERVCRLTDGAQTDRYTLFQFLQLINTQILYSLYQPTLPNDDGLLYYMEYKLKETKLVTFLLNHEVISIDNKDNYISNVNIIDKATSLKYSIKGNKYILALPPKQLNKLILNSSAKNAFGNINFMNTWANNNSYFEYIPITLHWKKKLDLPKIWGFPASDWGLAFIILSNYMKFKRNNELENSNTVISTAITFTDRKSLFTNKTADESNLIEIREEVMRQLRLSYPDIPEPDYFLISPQVYKNNGKWINSDTAFVSTPDKNQYIPFKSIIYNNLYNCGAQNGTSNYHFTSMETAVANAINLFNELEPTAQNKRYVLEYKQITNYIRIGIILLIIGIIIYIYRDKIKKLLYNI